MHLIVASSSYGELRIKWLGLCKVPKMVPTTHYMKQWKIYIYTLVESFGFPGDSMVKNLPARKKTRVWILGQEDFPKVGIHNPFQYSCLENPINRGAWQATVQRVIKIQTWLSDWAHTLGWKHFSISTHLSPKVIHSHFCVAKFNSNSVHHVSDIQRDI